MTGFFLILVCVGFFQVEKRIGTLAQQAAVAELNRTLNREIHLAVGKLMEEEAEIFHGITQAERDETGRIFSLSTDYLKVNRLKVMLAVKVEEVLRGTDVIRARIPVGMLISDSMMTGFGLPIPIRVFATNAVDVAIEDSFHSAGINQTRYKLEIVVKVPAQIAGLLHREETEVIVQVPVEEMILVGEVPKTYLARGD
ncbi:MAG: hypothetical protein IKW60_04470 [Clostridia bacterium]|nr:hypothetical protein [Clostridia bacterium]